jgi:putative DNA primase/helicase
VKTRVKPEPSQPDDGHNEKRKKDDLHEEIFEALKKGAVCDTTFRKLKIKPRKKLLGDWFREGDTGFIFSRRGVGKTWIAWAIARALARGEALGPWEAGEEAVKVCYLDGEMPAELMQQREIAFGDECENLTLINHEILFELTGHVLNLRLPEVQEAITQFCIDGDQKVLVVDNLSTLVSGVKENDSDAWELLLPWLLNLRRRKIAVILVHHAGRSGEMRGTSRREDSVFWIIKLEEDPDYTDKGCSFIQRFDKERNSPQSHYNHYIWTFKPTDEGYDNPSGEIEITFRVASLKSMVYDLILDGVYACSSIADELGVKRWSVSRAAKELAKEGKITIKRRQYRPVEEE